MVGYDLDSWFTKILELYAIKWRLLPEITVEGIPFWAKILLATRALIPVLQWIWILGRFRTSSNLVGSSPKLISLAPSVTPAFHSPRFLTSKIVKSCVSTNAFVVEIFGYQVGSPFYFHSSRVNPLYPLILKYPILKSLSIWSFPLSLAQIRRISS